MLPCLDPSRKSLVNNIVLGNRVIIPVDGYFGNKVSDNHVACLPCLKHAQDLLASHLGMAHASCQRRVTCIVFALNERLMKRVSL